MSISIASAAAVSLRTVRVTFSGAAPDATAIDPTQWVFGYSSGPGPYYTPKAVSVVGVDSSTTPTQIDISADQEFTSGVLYSVKGAAGIAGLTIDGSSNVGLFYGMLLQPAAGRDVAIIDMIPTINIQEDATGDLANFAACLQEVVNLVWNDIDHWPNIFDVDQASEQYLDQILASLGNQIDLPDLTAVEKRRLASVLVSIYKQKSSVPGLVSAIKFFVGLPAQITTFYGFGFILGDGILADGDYPGAGGGDPGTWVLGAGTPWSFTVKCATPTGVALSAAQVERVSAVLDKFKWAITNLQQLNASWDAPARTDIKDNGAGSVTITCAAVPGTPPAYQAFYRTSQNVNEWNGAVVALTARTVTLTPGATRYWKACVNNTVSGIAGLLSNEVTNALTAPVLTVTGQARNLHLSWPAVTGATSYRIYKSVSAATRPSAADNASNPIRVSGLTYDDPVESAITFYYIVVPLVGDSEGFYSNEAHATSN